jgi:germination protein M
MAKHKRASLGCLFWIALILLVVVVFLINQQNIQAVLKDTGFLTLFQKQENQADNKVTIKYNTEPEKNNDMPLKKDKQDDNEVALHIENPEQNKNEEQETKKSDQGNKEENEKTYIRKAKLYFVTMNKGDQFELKSVQRSVAYKDSPLTETLYSLLKGPNEKEFNNELMNLIPRQTKINNIYVKGDTAYLDFNEEFRFNSLGVFGLTAQLKQIVYTVTEFSNISQVQILINGKIVDYLAQEGVFVGKPLARKSFN